MSRKFVELSCEIHQLINVDSFPYLHFKSELPTGPAIETPIVICIADTRIISGSHQSQTISPGTYLVSHISGDYPLGAPHDTGKHFKKSELLFYLSFINQRFFLFR